MSDELGWKPDPQVPGRLRYWDGSNWTSHVSLNGEQFEEVFLPSGAHRWQYAVINIGMYFALDRMAMVLGSAGAEGWELVAIYDKTSNWTDLVGKEKGFILMKRPVVAGARLADDAWCIDLSLAGTGRVKKE